MNILRITLCAILFIAFVDAQRNFNLSKPIINLENIKPSPTWQRPPEERRKLSIFPKTTKKYMVSPGDVVKPDDVTVGSPTRRPLMRKFVVQDKDDKQSWYFAPREPLMKPKRFTVTVPPSPAPPSSSRIKDYKNSNVYDEIGEESQNIITVVTKPESELNKVKLNKINVFNAIQNEKANFTVLKGFKPVEKVVEEAKLDNPLFNQSLTINDVVKEQSLKLLSDYYQIDMRNMDIANLMEGNHEVPNESETIKTIDSTFLSDGIESRSFDSEMVAIDQSKDNFNKKDKIDNGPFNGLEQLIDIFGNDGDKLSENIPAYNGGKINTTQNEKDSMEDIQRVLVMGMNNNQEMNSLSNFDDHIPEVSQPLGGEDINLFSETGDFNNNITSENTLNSLQSFIDLIETDVIAEEITKMNSQIPNFLENQQNIDIDTIEEYTTEPIAIELELRPRKNIPIVQNINLSDVAQPTFFKTINIDSLKNPSAEEFAVETDTPNTLSKEHSDEASGNESDSEMSDEFLSDKLDINNETLDESKIDKSYAFTGKYTSKDSLNNRSNTLEEDATEKRQDVSNNLTVEDISNESNMADEETSNEASNELIIDTSNNLTTGVITKETIRVVSNKLTAVDILIESNVASEESSKESESISDEINASESILEVSSNLTIEDITNESNISGEKLYNKPISDLSNIMTEEVFNDSLVIEFTGKDLSDGTLHHKYNSLNGEDASEYIENVQNVRADEIPVEALRNRYKRSNNIIEEEHQATTISIFKYTGQPTRLGQDLSFKNINA